jgi:ribose transport system permease protein
MQVLRNMITLVTTRNNVEFAIIGAVILVGVIADEIARRIAARHRAAQALQNTQA